MGSLPLLIFFGFLMVLTQCRPSQTDENNESSQEEVDYEGDNGTASEDGLEESSFKDEEPGRHKEEQNRRLLDSNKNTFLQRNLEDDRSTHTNLEVPEFKSFRNREVRNDKSDEAISNNDESQNFPKGHQSSRYIESSDANDQLENSQRFTNRDFFNRRNSRIHNNMILDNPLNKRTVESRTANEEGALLFGNNRDQMNKLDKTDYNNEPFDSSERSPYAKQYYNPMQSDKKGIIDSSNRQNEYIYNNRDRREATKVTQTDSQYPSNVDVDNEGLDKTDSENEEMAIKRHIKQMSNDELEQLLNSLSGEKRALLKKIIDEPDSTEKLFDNKNKREVTKKAGAVEDNSYMESGQSESSQIQAGSAVTDISIEASSQSPGTTETNKQTENQPESTDLTNAKSTLQDPNLVDIKNSNNEEEKLDMSLNTCAPETVSIDNPEEFASKAQANSKTDSKRENNPEDLSELASFGGSKTLDSDLFAKESQSDEGYFCSQDEDFSQFSDEDQSRSYGGSKMYKRDADKQSELGSKIKSLEESFPNSDTYDETAPYSGPLIRVKRKSDQIVKKRSAGILSDSSVGFFPYSAECDDEDNDEGNEFNDEGFYDPTPNLAYNANIKDDYHRNTRDDANYYKSKISDQSKYPVSVANSNTIGLGSDTDNVLSSVDGVDENLMFSSGTRNRRKTDENPKTDNVDETNLIQSVKTGTSGDDSKTATDPDISLPTYQENDSFGALPRNYEGDLGRYKRIRRLKQTIASEEKSQNS